MTQFPATLDNVGIEGWWMLAAGHHSANVSCENFVKFSLCDISNHIFNNHQMCFK